MNNLSIRTKLTLMFLLVGLVPFLVTSLYLLIRFDNATTEEKLVELQGHNRCKKGQLERWFQERQGDLGVLSTSEEHIKAITQFRERALTGLAHEVDCGLLDC